MNVRRLTPGMSWALTVRYSFRYRRPLAGCGTAVGPAGPP
jgi:hypothetical protein